MPKAGQRQHDSLKTDGPVRFSLSELFPEFPLGSGQRKPFDKQKLIFKYTASGEVTDGGIVYQGGKGSAKTLAGACWDIWCHHHKPWVGMDSLIGRESYPSLKTSTAKEYFDIIKRLPDKMIKSASEPGTNNMGWVNWAVGGTSFLCSLSNADTWESANLGAAWVDEGHRQNPTIIGDLETRLRHPLGPRVMLITKNPGAQDYAWKWACPDPKNKSLRMHTCDEKCESPCLQYGKPMFRWIEATTLENPALPPGYHRRLVSRYGLNTPAYRRWVLGKSSALEGSVFTEFAPDVEDCLHVVAPFELPLRWEWGRGLDYGQVNPTVVTWCATDPYGNLWVDRCHYAPEKPEDRELWTVERHSEVIRAIDSLYGDEINIVPADPSIFARIHTNKVTGTSYSTADEFWENGVNLYQADNDRESGLQVLLDLIAIDPERIHPVSLKSGSPRLFVLDRPENAPLINELVNLQWARAEGTTEAGRPDDVQKRNDHAYDSVRYRAKETAGEVHRRVRAPITNTPDRDRAITVGSRGQTRAY